jgi:hypothetical protein
VGAETHGRGFGDVLMFAEDEAGWGMKTLGAFQMSGEMYYLKLFPDGLLSHFGCRYRLSMGLPDAHRVVVLGRQIYVT